MDGKDRKNRVAVGVGILLLFFILCWIVNGTARKAMEQRFEMPPQDESVLDRRLPQAFRELCEAEGWACLCRELDGTEMLFVSATSRLSPTGGTEVLARLGSVENDIALDLTAIPGYPLDDVWNIKKLRKLELRNSNQYITREDLKKLAKLRELVLDDCNQVFAFRGKSGTSETLNTTDGVTKKPASEDCSDSKIDAATLGKVTTENGFHNLKKLGLRGSAVDITSLRNLACCPNLEELDLSDRPALSLMGLASLPSLSVLTITDVDEITCIEELSKAPALKHVNCHERSFPKGEAPNVAGFRKIELPDGRIDYRSVQH